MALPISTAQATKNMYGSKKKTAAKKPAAKKPAAKKPAGKKKMPPAFLSNMKNKRAAAKKRSAKK